MFFKQEVDMGLNVDELLSPYLYLDETLVKDGNDGNACSKKFSNQGHGIPRATLAKLAQTAQAILNNEFEVSEHERLAYIDVFTLYSNHHDQQRLGDKPGKAEKEAMVLLLLKAAFKLSPVYDYEQLEQYSVRELSSHDQMLHYYAKALRYEKVSAGDRVLMLMNSRMVAQYLDTLAAGKELDPHAFLDRSPTRAIAVNYCYQDIDQFEKARDLMLPHLSLPQAFHRIQAYVQLAEIAMKQYALEKTGFGQIMQYANAAVAECRFDEDNTLLHYNARVCLMKAMQVSGLQEDATKLAQKIIEEMDANSDCGAKPDHRKEAEKILEANRLTAGLSI